MVLRANTICLGGAMLTLGVLLAGCGRSPAQGSRYQNFAGELTGRWVETGRVAMSVGSIWAGSAGPPRKLEGFITSDSEVYLNDRVVGLEELSVGDKVRVIGYFEPGEADQFWVALAYAEREMPTPAPLDVSVAATQPAASSPTSQEDRRDE
ncbi:MAG: hypothetical protein SF069_12250 [Phycisphaerae bacterium]|nr:hypothetical protein [Phycisphaerae bacterium]